MPRDREGTFEPVVVPKRKRDVSDIQDKVLSIYAKGMSQRDIADTIEDIYGFEISNETISEITDSVLEQLEEWQNRPLKRFYTFLFVDCLYVTIRKDYETKNYAVYVILGYDVDGQKDILGLWLSESESKHQWMQIFDEIKNRGVEDVLFLSMDGVSGLEEGAKAIFPNVTVQRCIVHLIRSSIRYVPNKDYKRFKAHLKKVYGAVSVKAAESEFERFKQTWSQYPGAVDVWVRNWQHVTQLFQYGSAVRKLQSVPEIHTYEHERRIEEQERRQRRREIRRNNRVNLVYTTVLAICATAVFVICYQYLNLQSNIKTNSTAVVELQNQLNSLKAENNSHESEINAGIDYNAIYDTAVNELGMVYPSRSQVIGYDSKESEYVKQYKDISK